MTERLARLAVGQAKLVVVLGLVLFALAGALGAGVAQRLDPFGAEDPATESVVADQRLQDAGYRETGVIVLVRGTDPREPGGRERIAAIARRLRGDRDVAAVASYISTPSRNFVSRDGRSTYLAVALGPTGDRARQDAAARIAESFARTPGVSVGGPALAERQVNEQVERDLRTAELYAFPAAVPALPAVLPQPRRRAASAARRWPGDRRHAAGSACRQRAHLGLDLRAQRRHRARAGAGDRLQPLHRLPLPRGD